MASETTIEQGLRYETAAIRETLASPDYELGLAAFAEKQAPEFLAATVSGFHYHGPVLVAHERGQRQADEETAL